jgi:L-arabinose isomerase
MGLYHGKWGAGVSVEAKVKTGPVTLLGVTQTVDGRLKMIANQGEATNGEILRIGNTMTPVRFAKGPSQFMNEWFALGPTHHVAMSVGSNAGIFRKVATLLGWPFDTVCL